MARIALISLPDDAAIEKSMSEISIANRKVVHTENTNVTSLDVLMYYRKRRANNNNGMPRHAMSRVVTS